MRIPDGGANVTPTSSPSLLRARDSEVVLEKQEQSRVKEKAPFKVSAGEVNTDSADGKKDGCAMKDSCATTGKSAAKEEPQRLLV